MLTWDEERGYGHYPVKQEDRPYDAAYFEKYRKMANTPIGHSLTKARVDLVRKYYPGFNLVDVGIGSGQFVTASGMLGYDVNPAGVEWLNQRNRFADMYIGQYDAMTFWDSLEHIDDMSAAVQHIERFAFVSIPVFSGYEDVLASKHFRPDEHIHYFTVAGLIRWFDEQGFNCREYNQIESDIGREGIGTFVFERKPA